MDNYNLIDIIKNKYLSNNKEDVLKHVETVAELAVGLAEVYSLDVTEIKLAALLHDISGVMTPQEMYDFAIAHGLETDPAEEKYHALLHQRVSKIIAQDEFGIVNSDILNAIECHTTLRKNASLYDKIIFIADKISWDQKFDYLYETLTKNATIEALNKACYEYIKYQFDNNLLVMAHRWLLDAFDELKIIYRSSV